MGRRLNAEPPPLLISGPARKSFCSSRFRSRPSCEYPIFILYAGRLDARPDVEAQEQSSLVVQQRDLHQPRVSDIRGDSEYTCEPPNVQSCIGDCIQPLKTRIPDQQLVLSITKLRPFGEEGLSQLLYVIYKSLQK